MKLETFFEKFELFADAPNAVAKMRELILELAIQGKLVSQDGSDEPASKQLERIAAKKAKAGRIVRAKVGRAGISTTDEAATHVPDGWAKASLADLVTVLNGRAYSKDELLNSGVPVLRVGNLFTSNHWYYSNLVLEADKYCDQGDLIFAWSASFGPFIWPGPKVIYHYHIWKLELHSEADLSKHFLYWFLQNKTQEIKRAGHGVSMLHMTKEKMERLEVMVPPLAEQKRIVAKVDELMALCDRLEAQQQKRDTRHVVLARASLARFAEAPTPANLDFLFHQFYPITPSDLRKTILTLAVQGQLVPQDPDDIPSDKKELEEKIAPRVQAKGRTGADLGEITDAEVGIEIPGSWVWTRLFRLCEQDAPIVYGILQPGPDVKPAGVPYVRPTEIKGGKILLDDVRHTVDEIAAQYTRSRVKTGDILLTIVGTLGATAVIPRELDGGNITQSSCRIRPNKKLIDPAFLVSCLQSPFLAAQYQRFSLGSAVRRLNIAHVRALVIPLPPLAEQRRIVVKVDQLMALVDELEAQLTASRATAEKLMEALVSELTGSGGACQPEQVTERQVTRKAKAITA